MKKYLMIAMLIGMPTISLAQQPQPSQPSEYNLKVSPAELELISKGLGTQAFNDVLPLVNKLRSQVMEQQPKPPVVEAPQSKQKDNNK